MINLNFPNPVISERGFFDRRLEWDRIHTACQSADRKPIIICGERRIGKTSLQTVATERLAAIADPHRVPVVLPFGGQMRSSDDFARELLQGVCTATGVAFQEVDQFTTDGTFRLASIGQYAQVLRELLEQVGETEFLICVDEFDVTYRHCAGRDADRLIALVTHLARGAQTAGLRLRFFFSMTGVPGTLRETFGTTFVTESEVIEVGTFSQQDMMEMVTTLLGPTVRVLEPAIARLYELSGGHPYITKLLLHHWLRLHDFVVEGATLDAAGVDEAAKPAVIDSHADHALGNLYQVHFEDPQKAVLLWLTQHPAGIGKEDLLLRGPEYVTAAKQLAKRGYLEPVGRQEVYRFRIGFLGLWLQAWERFESEARMRSLAVARERQTT